MKLWIAAIALTTLVVYTSALPQQQGQQQLTPEQQQQRLLQQQQGQQQLTPEQQLQRLAQQQLQQQQSNNQVAGDSSAAGASGVTTPIPLHLDPNLTLNKISKKNLDDFLASKEAVNELVSCFENIKNCRAKAGVSLVRDVRSLGRGGRCKDCTPEEQAHTRGLVGQAISGLQQRHPVEWRRLLPEIGFLL